MVVRPLQVSDRSLYLPMWPSSQSNRAPCAVEHDALSGQGSNLSSGVSAYQKIISDNSCAQDEQGDNPGQEKRGFDGVLYALIGGGVA